MKTFFPPLKGAPRNNPQHLSKPLSSAITHPAFLTDTAGLFRAFFTRGTSKSSPKQTGAMQLPGGGNRTSASGWEGTDHGSLCHAFCPPPQAGNKSQDDSSSAGQPSKPKAAASAIPSRAHPTARYSHLQSGNQPPEVWSMCSSSLRWKQQGLTQEIAWRLKLTASSRI